MGGGEREAGGRMETNKRKLISNLQHTSFYLLFNCLSFYLFVLNGRPISWLGVSCLLYSL